MNFLKKLFFNISLRSQRQGSKAFIPWSKVKTLALVIDSKSCNNKNKLDKFIYESDKVVDVYYIDLKEKESAFKNVIALNKKDKNLFDLPGGQVKSKLDKHYDLLINAAFNEDVYAAVLSHKMRSTFKCGYKSFANEFDLVLKRNQNQDVFAFLDEMVNYLMMIKN